MLNHGATIDDSVEMTQSLLISGTRSRDRLRGGRQGEGNDDQHVREWIYCEPGSSRQRLSPSVATLSSQSVTANSPSQSALLQVRPAPPSRRAQIAFCSPAAAPGSLSRQPVAKNPSATLPQPLGAPQFPRELRRRWRSCTGKERVVGLRGAGQGWAAVLALWRRTCGGIEREQICPLGALVETPFKMIALRFGPADWVSGGENARSHGATLQSAKGRNTRTPGLGASVRST